jgi:import inner membrane translocase subunit TIM44
MISASARGSSRRAVVAVNVRQRTWAGAIAATQTTTTTVDSTRSCSYITGTSIGSAAESGSGSARRHVSELLSHPCIQSNTMRQQQMQIMHQGSNNNKYMSALRQFSSTPQDEKKKEEPEENTKTTGSANDAAQENETTATTSTETTTAEEDKDKDDKIRGGESESLRDVINKLKQQEEKEGSSSSSTSPPSFDADTLLYQFRTGMDSFRDEVAKTWDELLASNQSKGVNKKIHDPIAKEKRSSNNSDEDEPENVDDEAADKYDGVTAISIIKEQVSAWEKMQRRLTEAPIIQNILGASSEAFKKVGGDKAKQRLDDIKADASEAWETSQNPWVYRLSSVYDTLTAESEFALATKELRRLDPEFTSLEQFKQDAMDTLIPEIMGYIMEGQTKQLKPLMGEAVYNRLAAEIRVRKSEGLLVDPHILGMENSEILAAELDENQRGSPIILLHYMCQQINCVRKKDDGEIVEGGEDEIRANSYIVALQREYDDQEGALNWKVIDFRFNGGIPWI